MIQLSPSSGLLSSVLLSALLSASALAAPQNAQITQDEIKEHVTFLASDALEGRGTGTQGERKAAAYIAKCFGSYGLKPGGEDGTWFQSFKVAGKTTLAKGATLTVEAGGWEKSLALNSSWRPFGFSSSFKGELPLVFVGFGVTKEGYDDYANVDVKGKAVVMLRREPNVQGRGTRHAYFTTKAANAMKHGAKAFLLINDDGHPSGDSLMPFGATQDAGIAAAQVRRSDFVKLFALIGKDLSALEAEIEDSQRPQSFPLGTMQLSIDVERKPVVARNVIGYLPGSDPSLKAEVVVLGAHYDHLGAGHHGGSLGGRGSQGQIHNGADDNASGTAGVLELAQAFAKNPPKRSMLFILFSGEERGLLGSAHYAKNPTVKLDTIAAMINLDMIGRLRDDKLEVGGVGTAAMFPELVKGALESEKLTGQLTQSGFGPSDHASFCRVGVPVLFLFTGLHGDYHRPTDDVERLNAEGAAKVTRVAERCARAIADAKEKPAFVKVQRAQRQRGPRGPRIGIMLGREQSSEGVQVGEVQQGGAADKAGLEADDVIVELAGHKITDVSSLRSALGKCKKGQKVKVKFKREGEALELDLTLE